MKKTVQLIGYSSDSAEESLVTEPCSSMTSTSQNSPKSDLSQGIIALIDSGSKNRLSLIINLWLYSI